MRILAGKIVDLYTYLTGQTPPKGKLKSPAQLIRNGVPAGLETDKGLVIIGAGRKVTPRTIAKHAGKKVELKGRLYEKAGLKYIDVEAIVLAGKGKSPEAKRARPQPREGQQKRRSTRSR